MNGRALLFGSERGAALAVVVGFLVVVVLRLLDPALEPPFDPWSVGYVAVVATYALPALFIGAYGGGLLPAWAVQVAAALVVGPGFDAGFVVSPAGFGAAGTALVVGVALGTLGFALGRLADAAWARRPGVPTGGGA